MKSDMERIASTIRAHDGVRIAEKELRTHVCTTDYDDYYNIVIKLVDSNVITPVKSSGSNGMRPPLYKRYNIIKPESNYDELIPEIRLLHGRFNIEGYLNEPARYKSHKKWILPLDSFFKNNAESLVIPFSINERSFQIFGREKALKEDRELAAVLSFNPGLKEALNIYNTPEPFLAFHIKPFNTVASLKYNDLSMRPGINILIIENKDTWYTLRNRMSLDFSCIAGVSFHCLLYGEGKKISRKMDTLTDFDESYFKGAKTRYYYFGDLDYEGIGIVHDLISVNPALQIELMLPLYTAMLEASEGIGKTIKGILESGRYIPQEILNNGDFLKIIHSNTRDTGEDHV